MNEGGRCPTTHQQTERSCVSAGMRGGGGGQAAAVLRHRHRTCFVSLTTSSPILAHSNWSHKQTCTCFWRPHNSPVCVREAHDFILPSQSCSQKVFLPVSIGLGQPITCRHMHGFKWQLLPLAAMSLPVQHPGSSPQWILMDDCVHVLLMSPQYGCYIVRPWCVKVLHLVWKYVKQFWESRNLRLDVRHGNIVFFCVFVKILWIWLKETGSSKSSSCQAGCGCAADQTQWNLIWTKEFVHVYVRLCV